jgi:lipopolysaccharide/colanic/teichoic acid biosynthesis glycosyltransferase
MISRSLHDEQAPDTHHDANNSPACAAGSRPSGGRLPAHGTPVYFRYYSYLNRFAACLLLVPAAPLILLTVVLVRLTSKGPAIFCQTRVGRNGQKFMLYKVRTMVANAEATTGPVWTISHRDYRITPLGRLLRLTHLDELPQLWNVIRGDMALVGPRPERPEFTRFLATEVPGYLDRLAVLPGITGLAQINLPPDSDVSSVQRKLLVDLEYIQRGSLWLDLRIIFCTVFQLVSLHSKSVRRLLGVHCTPQRLIEDMDTLLDGTLPDINTWRSSPHAERGRRLPR